MFSENTQLNYEDSLSIVQLLRKHEVNQGVDIFRALAIIDVESNGDPLAVSSAGALGLMQIMPGTARFISYQRQENLESAGELLIVSKNIIYGTWYYSYLLQMFKGDEHAALAAYNWGPGHIRNRQSNGVKLPKRYPRKVFLADKNLQEKVYERTKMDFWRRAIEYDCLCGRSRNTC